MNAIVSDIETVLDQQDVEAILCGVVNCGL